MRNRNKVIKILIYILMTVGIFAASAVMTVKGFIWGIIAVLPFAVSFVLFYYYDSSNTNILSNIKYGEKISAVKLAYFDTMPVPVVFIGEGGNILNFNQEFENIFITRRLRKNTLLEDLLPVDMKKFMTENIFSFEQNGRYYRMYGVSFNETDENIKAVCIIDDTDYVELQNNTIANRPCIMVVSIDNFQETLSNAKESEKAKVSAAIESLIDEYISLDENVITLKSTQDTFIVMMKEYNLRQIIQGKFQILDEARKIETSQKSAITLSIGTAFGAESLSESQKLAMQSLDMALGRGGDQAAVRSEHGTFSFFGGVSKGVEKKSRTKTRAVANALKDLILKSDKIFIMGHQYSDLDSVGAACGMYAAVKMLGRESCIVISKENTLAGRLVEKISGSANPPKFVDPADALQMVTDSSLLIIVDTHNKKIIESTELYSLVKNVVVIDHHRKVVDYIDNALIFYHEPFASSACEMVTELIQYLDLPRNLDKEYTDALLSGIMTDTKNFVMQTGVRTFEAAAYLIKMGADTITVRKLFADSMSAFRERAKIVSDASIYKCCAISLAGKSESANLKVIASQAADKLLEIKDVSASFVIYSIKDTVNISARSIGQINVQLLMEKLGGGGHRNMAATQLKGVSQEKARMMLIEEIKKADEEGELIK